MDKQTFSAAVARMREVPGGEVHVHDWPTRESPARAAYRYARVRVEVEPADLPARAADLAAFAYAIQGNLVLMTFKNKPEAEIEVSLSRDLDAEEVAALANATFEYGAAAVPLDAA